MAKIKIHEYAKQIDKPSKELVEFLIRKGFDVKTHMSSIGTEEVNAIKEHYKITEEPRQSIPKQQNPSVRMNSARAVAARSSGSVTSARSIGSVVRTASPVKKTGQEEKTENPEVKTDVQAVKPETKADTVSLTKPENSVEINTAAAESAAKPEVKAEVKNEVKQETRPQAGTENGSATKPEAKPEAKTPVKNESNSETQNDTEVKAEAKQENRTDARTDRKNESKPEVKKDKKPDNKPEDKADQKTTNNKQDKSEVKTVFRTENSRKDNKNQDKSQDKNKDMKDGRQGQGGRDNRDSRDGRQGQGGRDNRDSRDGRQGFGGRDGRDGRQGFGDRDGRDGRDNRDSRDGRQGQGGRDNRDGRDGRQGQGGRDNRDSRDGRQGFGGRDNRDGRDGRQGQGGRDNRDSRDGRQGFGGRDGRDGRQGFGDRDGRDGRDSRDGRQGRDGRDGRQGGRDNRSGFGGKDDKQFVSSVFNPANSSKNSDNSRNRTGKNNNKKNSGDKKYDDSKENFEGLKKKDNKPKKGQFIKPEPVKVEEPSDGIRTIILPDTLSIKELADKLKTPSANLIKKLFMQGKIVTLNNEISFEDAEEIALEFNCIAEREEKVDTIAEILKDEEDDESKMVKRPPVVCVMGHVDHGKTSLLDAIRQTHVTDKEAGGITQHIGAYVVNINGEKITFLDTPGHEAFTSMRMRGANSTDIAILVVAADDGVMPQTIEAINHAKAAGIQIIVAINKIDKPSANIERVKQELVEYGLIAEDWGGDTVFVPVSAHTKEGIDTLLDMILLTAEMCEFKANPDRKARGLVIEAQLDKGRGPVATVLIQKGTLRVGDPVSIGSTFGKVRAMIDDKGRRVKHARPSTPVEILGLNDVPNSGEILIQTDNEKEARSYAEEFIRKDREKLKDDTRSKLSLDGLFSQIQAGNIKELNIIVKADVQGSVEAVRQSLEKLSNEEVAVKVIHGGVGSINESDVTLAAASNAIVIGFNVRPDNQAKEVADREKVDMRLYKVIYNAIEDVEAAMKGMLDPIFVEKVIGHAEVRQTFKASGVGTIAGSYVLDGKIVRGASARITRDGELIYTGNLASLKRFKDDVKEVATGYECGLVFEKFNDFTEFDQIEFYVMEEVPR